MDDDHKQRLLELLLQQKNADLVFWRERNWMVLRDTVGSLVFITGLSLFQGGAAPALLFLILGIAVLATVYLLKNYKRYKETRHQKNRIEMSLRLHEKGVFLPDDSLLPESCHNATADPRGSFSFILGIWLIAVATSTTVSVKWISSDEFARFLDLFR